MEISVELKVLMTRSGMTGKQVADKTGMPKSKVSKILKANQVPDWADIVSIARSCNYEPTLTFEKNEN